MMYMKRIYYIISGSWPSPTLISVQSPANLVCYVYDTTRAARECLQNDVCVCAFPKPFNAVKLECG